MNFLIGIDELKAALNKGKLRLCRIILENNSPAVFTEIMNLVNLERVYKMGVVSEKDYNSNRVKILSEAFAVLDRVKDDFSYNDNIFNPLEYTRYDTYLPLKELTQLTSRINRQIVVIIEEVVRTDATVIQNIYHSLVTNLDLQKIRDLDTRWEGVSVKDKLIGAIPLLFLKYEQEYKNKGGSMPQSLKELTELFMK